MVHGFKNIKMVYGYKDLGLELSQVQLDFVHTDKYQKCM